MCEFHLKGQCFHPEKAKKGLVATGCKFQDCSECTNKHWQKDMIEENYAYYQSIVTLTKYKKEQSNDEESKPLLTRIFSTTK